MGFSKKKQKNFKKAQARVGPKAKQKVRKAKQIEQQREIQASKRRAAEATRPRKAGKAEGDVRDIKSVDALFASIGGEDGEEEDDGDLIEPDGEGSDDESSAGAFEDPGDGGDDDDDDDVRGGEEDLEDEDEGDAGARHEEELKAIKEKDPEFYKFLLEQDKSLLSFSAPADDERDEDAEDKEGEEAPEDEEGAAPKGPASGNKVITRDRLERVQASAKSSWTACKAAANLFHTAVKSIEASAATQEKERPDTDKKKRRKKPARSSKNRGAFVIEDEGLFSEVIEWSVANLLLCLRSHAGEFKAGAAGKRSKKGRKGDDAASGGPGAASLLDPTKFARWSRVKIVVHIFWKETIFLLNHLSAPHLLEFVLRHFSTPEVLCWLWPFKTERQRFLRRCCYLWASAPGPNARLMAFMVLRNSAAMILLSPVVAKGTQTQRELEGLLRGVIRSFADMAARGYSWGNLNTFRFLENSIVELLRLEDAVAYRLGYVCLRQLALILRNACVATSHVGGDASGGGKGKKDKKKGQKSAEQQVQALTSWPFVRAISLWSRAISTLPSLKPLAYPLSMIILGAVKNKLTSVKYFPFVIHCLTSLNRLAARLEVFAPISSHLLKAIGLVFQSMESLHKKKRKDGEEETLDSSVKAPELEVTLHLSESQVASSLCLEALGSSLCFLFVDHLGLLSQSPGYPEMISPVMIHLRKHSKHCRSEPMRRQLKSLIEKAEASAASVRARREALTEPPDPKKFLLFEPDTAIAKARIEALKRRAAEEKSRVQAEAQEDGKGGAAASAAAGKEKSRRSKKQKRKAEAVADGDEESAPKKPKAGRRERERHRQQIEVRQRGSLAFEKAKGSMPTRDEVQEMDFGKD